MSSIILMVFEGAKTEEQICNNLKKYFIENPDNQITISVYGTVIYDLFDKLSSLDLIDNESLDVVSFLKESGKFDNLESISNDKIGQVYLFFDYDGHDHRATNEKISQMLELFDNETEKGKLFISYPMVEAIKHLKEGIDFKDIIEKSNSSYKQLVSQNCDQHLTNLTILTADDWDRIIQEHSKKANFIVNGDFVFPSQIFEQSEIFNHQKEKFIKPYNKVAVLASFPLFLLDYYGVKKFINKE